MTQAFFARVFEKNALRHADPARGRLRSFLLTSLTHFVINEHQRAAAQKRGGGAEEISIDADEAEGRFRQEPSTGETPESLYDRAWAMTLLARTIAHLKDESERGGEADLFERLQPYLTGDRPSRPYAETAIALGMSEAAVKVAVHRLRRRFRDLLRQEIASTVSSADEIEDELRHLWSAVAS